MFIKENGRWRGKRRKANQWNGVIKKITGEVRGATQDSEKSSRV